MPEQFWELSPAEFYYKLSGFREGQEQQFQQNWERTRWMTWYLIQPHVKKNSFKNPNDLIEFPWEKQPEKHPNQNSEIDREVKDWMKKMDEDHLKKFKKAYGNTRGT